MTTLLCVEQGLALRRCHDQYHVCCLLCLHGRFGMGAELVDVGGVGHPDLHGLLVVLLGFGHRLVVAFLELGRQGLEPAHLLIRQLQRFLALQQMRRGISGDLGHRAHVLLHLHLVHLPHLLLHARHHLVLRGRWRSILSHSGQRHEEQCGGVQQRASHFRPPISVHEPAKLIKTPR